jgi:primosomal replication protein N''
LCLATAFHEWALQIEANSEPLQKFNQSWYEHTRAKLKEKLEKKRNSVIPFIKAQWLSKREQASQQNWEPVLALGGRGSKKLRQIIEMGRPLGLFDMIPCWIMDPTIASRLFPLEPKLFDVVVFDEASQCPLEQAIPAIYRGRSIVVAGDEKQLPPTSFLRSAFDMDTTEISHRNRLIKAENLPDEELFDKEMENWGAELAREVEDLLTASTDILPGKFLDIHYRSRFSELIEFSNNAFYEGRLQAPTNALLCEGQITKPIVLYQVNGQYEKQRNEQEALKIVAILEDIFQWDADPPTIGVVTFSQPQAELIDFLLDRQSETSPDFRSRLDWQRQRKKEHQDEGLFVKNLENVQGDERDIIILSTTFGNGPDGVFRRHFGPLNSPRRLNVAISRARLQKIVVTSLPIDQISPAQNIDPVPGVVYGGKEFLHLYMKYVRAVDRPKSENQRQILKLARELGKGSGGDGGTSSPESAFEEDVRDRLSRRFQETGLQHLAVESQVACSAFRIDLAVRDLESGRYILGIECDGQTYHSSASARFRDIWRQDILEEFRWKMHRLWSQNWWTDPAREIDKIVDKVKSLTAR